jgi:exodeoxyribonuclease-3
VSRLGLEEVRAGFSDAEAADDEECRLLAATCGGAQVMSVYVPNGRIVGSEVYAAKLLWLERLRRELDSTVRPDAPIAVCGDFNVAPSDLDVFDITRFEGATHVTAAERGALGNVLAWGLHDVLREREPAVRGPFSWWDYRGGAFHKGEGMRIDLALLSRPLADAVTSVFVDREERKKGASGEVPSDHAPVVVDLVKP